MPRRGQYTVLFQEPVYGLPVPHSRIGVREAISRPGTATSARRCTIDPALYRCATLVGQVADEWVTWAQVNLPDATTLSVSRQAIIAFAEYVDAHARAPQEVSLASASDEAAQLLREWRRTLPAGYRQGSRTPWLLDNYLTRLIKLRAQRQDAAIGEPLRQLLAGFTSVRAGATQELDEFTRQEKNAVIRAGWASVIEAEQRLERGRALLKEAGDPALREWSHPADLLGLLASGEPLAQIARMLPDPQHWPAQLWDIAQILPGTRNRRLRLLRSLTSLLYPRDSDLHAFRALLVAATGLVDEIGALSEHDVEFAGDDVVLTLTKMRSHTVRKRRFAGHSPLNPAELVQRLMTATEAARARCGVAPAPLFTFATVGKEYDLQFPARRFAAGGRSFSTWARSRGVELSDPVDIRRIRKSVKVEKIIAHRGEITAAADDHTVETFLGHYASGTAVRVIAGQIMVGAQREWLQRAMAAPRILDQDTVTLLDDDQVQTRLGLTAEAAEQLRHGALNMGVTDCRDPFDAPHGRRGELCAVAPLHCLECGNALILPSSLPQLLLMADHIESMRVRLAPPLFTAVWGQRRANLNAALAERSPAEIEHARGEIARQNLRLQLPLSSHTEFDL